MTRLANSIRALKPGDVFRFISGQTDSPFLVEYTNSSGAYCVPLSATERTINGKIVQFHPDGRTISLRSIVEIINPLSLGGNSQEYRRYVKMVAKSKEKSMHGATLGDFEEGPADGHTADAGSETAPTDGGMNMATATATKGKAKTVKAKPAAKASVRKKKPVKTVRSCVCGCGGETTGHFVPGHDARFHGWLKRLADGRMKPAELPAAVRKSLGLVETKDGFKATHPHYYQEG